MAVALFWRIYSVRTSQSNRSWSQCVAFILSFFVCENSFKVHLAVPAVKCHCLSSKPLLQRPDYLPVACGEVHDCCLTEYQEAFIHGDDFARSPLAAPLFILTHLEWWELTPAIIQMLARSWALWLRSKANFKSPFFCFLILSWQQCLAALPRIFWALHRSG